MYLIILNDLPEGMLGLFFAQLKDRTLPRLPDCLFGNKKSWKRAPLGLQDTGKSAHGVSVLLVDFGRLEQDADMAHRPRNLFLVDIDVFPFLRPRSRFVALRCRR